MSNDYYPSSRIFWIDWAKTILIALVCVGHYNSPDIQKQLIWGFHMPAFFMISGYLYRRRDWWKTLYSFAVPTLFYTAIVFGVHVIQEFIQKGYWDYKFDLNHFYHRVIEQYFIRNADNQYGIIPFMFWIWFVVALVVARFLSGDIKWFSFTLKHSYLVLGVLLIWLTIEPLIWDYIPVKDIKLYYGIYALPFFLIGYIFKSLRFDIQKINPLIMIGLLTIYCIITLNLPRFDMMNYQCGPTFIVFFANALCGSLLLFWLTTFLPQNKYVEVFSVGTLLLLTLHMPMDFFILPIFFRLGITPPNNIIFAHLIPWIEMCVCFLICYYPIVWLNNNCSILLGKIHSRTR